MFNFLATLHLLLVPIDQGPRLDYRKKFANSFGQELGPEKWRTAIWSPAGWVLFRFPGLKKTSRLSHTCFKRLPFQGGDAWKELGGGANDQLGD